LSHPYKWHLYRWLTPPQSAPENGPIFRGEDPTNGLFRGEPPSAENLFNSNKAEKHFKKCEIFTISI